MLLGGLWHGAAWTFVVWGAIHGALLAVNHAWHAMRERLGMKAGRGGPLGRLSAVIFVLLVVTAAWVPFRAPNMDVTFGMWRSMFDPARSTLLGGGVPASTGTPRASERPGVMVDEADLLRRQIERTPFAAPSG